ncbi:sugar ABC transporter substrate-binding protein [Bacillus sp. UNC438CL73TsuS30]|uniref:sugar ABC transporter substrate-binding protein n=1 Tax=Bacillus sp. UNC438CL73TsuS30 TaxID=1340434 RepID=UPI00047D5C3D|nr:sugar ABC transporter substrate-binding protein [Bacillus sp. UNC438CL73TsuS30]
MKKYMKAMIPVLLFGALASGCGSTTNGSASSNQKDSATSSSQGKPKVGVVFKALNDEYWKIMQAGAEAAGKKYGVDVEVAGPADETQVIQQVSMIEDDITKKVSALAVAPSQPATVLPAFQKAKQANIPLVLIDSDASFPDKVSFVGTGNFEAGKQAGKFIASKLQKGDKVAIIRGSLGDNTHDERTNGAEEALKAAGINIASVQPADSDRNKALSVMENILQTQPDIKAVYGTSDEMALGALRALKSEHSKAFVVGFNGSSNALDSIKAGDMTASIAQDPYKIGYLGVEAAVKAMKKEAVDKRIDSGTKVITKDNVVEFENNLKQILGK